jgi:hypothetical protein
MMGVIGLTINEAEAGVGFIPPLVALTVPLVFTFVPSVMAVTSTLTVQVPDTGITPPENVIDVAYAKGAKVGEPQLAVTAFGMAATFTPAGKLSLKVTPIRSTVFPVGFVSVNVRVLFPLTGMVPGAKALLMVGGATAFRVALVVLPEPSSVEMIGPLVLFFVPPVVAVTATVNVQVVFAAIVPPVKSRVVAPAPGAKVLPVPQFVLFIPGVVATCTPVGRLSVKCTFVR